MAGKLSIRRVGTILPTLSLVGLLLVIGIIIWLCTAGLPGCALRYIEKEAAKAGIELRIHKIKLHPRAGLALKAEKIIARQQQPDAAPAEIHLRKARISFRLARLLSGEYRPEDIQLSDGTFTLPLSDTPGDELVLNNVDIYTAFFRNTDGLSANLTAELCNVDLQVRLGATDSLFSSNETDTDGTDATNDSLAEMLAEFRPRLREVKSRLEGQQWTRENRPSIAVSLYASDKWRAQLKASIPSYEIGNIHFRDAILDARVDNNTITVNNLKFRTVSPDTQIKLQGGYNWVDRELEFNTISTAPVVKMLNGYLGEDTPQVLQKLTSADGHTPTIELNGNASLSEDYAINNISLRGKIEQNNLHLGAVPVDQAHLSFYMRNGQFSIDTLRLTMPDGHIMGEAYAANETGYANLDLSLPDETLLALARELCPDTTISLPEGLSFDSNLQLRAKANLNLPNFEPGKSHLGDLIPELSSCDIQFNCGQIVYNEDKLTNNALMLSIHGIDYSGENIRAKGISLNASVGKTQMPEFNAGTSDAQFSLQLGQCQWNQQSMDFSIEQADLKTSADSVIWDMAQVNKFQFLTNIDFIRGNLSDPTGTLQLGASHSYLNTNRLTCGEYETHGIALQADTKPGLTLTNFYQNIQADSHIEVQDIRGPQELNINKTYLKLGKTSADSTYLHINCNCGKLSTSLRMQDDGKFHLNVANCELYTSRLTSILDQYLPKEIKLPREIKAKGSAVIDSASGRVESCQYELTAAPFVRVCHNVHVHKGMEIPLTLTVKGDFTTSEDGNMHYAADVEARHQLGELKVHVGGDPLKECHITGSNTIPVNIVNALIDDEDAHWIMRDFRCQDGITRNNITNIDTTIRYDKGVYVHARCNAELRDMDFLLGAILDKEDAQGAPTGEEYLRTDLGKDPYSRIKHGTCEVDVLVQLDCVDTNGKPLADRIDINLLNPDLLYDNRPWLKRMGIKGGALTSRISGEAVRFNIEDYTISLHKLKGTCYPAYSIGMYYAPIQHFMEDVKLDEPADIETDYCIFPLSRRCEIPMKGLIRAEAAKGAGYRFLGTTIPFTNFSGFINISDVDVYLDRMNAQCWGGRLDGSLRINFAGKHTTLDGYFVANTLNLKDIVASYGEQFTPATCSGFIRFQAAEPTLEAIRGYGQVHLTDGDLMQIGLFRPIGAFLADVPGNLSRLQESVHLKKENDQPSWVDKFIRSIFSTGSDAIDAVQTSAYKIPFANHFLRYGIDEAFARFDLVNGHLISRDMKARGYNLDVDMKLDIDLDKLTLNGDLWPRISSVPTLIISPITILSDFLIDIEVYGDLTSPQWKFGLSKKLKGSADSVSSGPQKSEPLKTE